MIYIAHFVDKLLPIAMDVDTSGFEQQNPDEDIDDIVREYNIQVSDLCFLYLPTGGRWHNTGCIAYCIAILKLEPIVSTTQSKNTYMV